MDPSASLDLIEHYRRCERTAAVISGILGLALGAALMAALWAATLRFPWLF